MAFPILTGINDDPITSWSWRASTTAYTTDHFHKEEEGDTVIFALKPSFSVKDWFDPENASPFGETKMNHDQFPCMRSIGNDVDATVNEAFLKNLQLLLSTSFPDSVITVVDSMRSQRIVFTGHSSGGATAILATVWYLEKYFTKQSDDFFPEPLCLTFGAPLVGDDVFKHALGRENWSRFFVNFVTRFDIVPRIMLARKASTKQVLPGVLSLLDPRASVQENDQRQIQSTNREIRSMALEALAGISNALIATSWRASTTAYTTEHFLMEEEGNTVFFALRPSFLQKDWFDPKNASPFGETKMNREQFPCMRSIGNDVDATVNEAFLKKLQLLLSTPFPHFVKKVVDSQKSQRIVFTGHSSGGATAILATVWYLETYFTKQSDDFFPEPLCLTFGAPLVGDYVFNHALGRENWSRFFVNFVTRFDKGIKLAPNASTEQALPYALSQLVHTASVQKNDPSIACFYAMVMKDFESAARQAGCELNEDGGNGFLETFSSCLELSPYRPAGTFVFSTGTRLVPVSNSDAILQILFYASQSSNEQELSLRPYKSIRDHHSYQESVRSMRMKVFHQLDLNHLALDRGETALSDLVLTIAGFYATGMTDAETTAREENMNFGKNSRHLELSPYRPAGTFVFSTGTRLLSVGNSDAILQILFYSSQSSNEQELSLRPYQSIRDHHNYQEVVDLLAVKSLNHLPLDGLYVLSDFRLTKHAKKCVYAAFEADKKRRANQSKIDAKLRKIVAKLTWIEKDYKLRCQTLTKGYYDSFKESDEEKDFRANVTRAELAGIFEEVLGLVKEGQLPDGFERSTEWIELATRYRKLVEPLDIANYYRHLKNQDTGPYMKEGRRPKRYKHAQRLYEHKLLKEGRSAEEIKRSGFGSCFWAEVEELRGKQYEYHKERVKKLEELLEGCIRDKEVDDEHIFLEGSPFRKWWHSLPDHHKHYSPLRVRMV